MLKKIFHLFILFVFIARLSSAQTSWVDIITDPVTWQNREANLSIQISPLPKIAFRIGFGFRAIDGINDNFKAESSKRSFNSEIRFFPFGNARQVFQKSKLPEFWKHRKKTGCPTESINRLSGLAKGIYIAPGFIYQKEDLRYLPLPDKESPIQEFRYQIRNKGGSLALGYQIHLSNLTFDAGWLIQVTQPRWSGPIDIFDDEDFYTTTYPWKLNIQNGPRLEVGINF